MNGDDQIADWRQYRMYLKPFDDINILFRRSVDPRWIATRELLARMGWTNLDRLAVISGEVLGQMTHVLLPDETVAEVLPESGTYETCSVQEYADWDIQYAEPLWYTVVWVRYQMKRMLEYTQDLRNSDEPKWRAVRAFVRSNGVDASASAIEEMVPDQGEEVCYIVGKDKRRFSFDIPYADPQPSHWSEEAPEYDLYPHSYKHYEFACWFLDAEQGKASDWIFTRPYDWWEKVKPGWNPPFGKPTFETPEEAALMMWRKHTVRVESVTRKDDNKADVSLEDDNDPSGQFPMTITCEQLPSGRWRQVPPKRIADL